MGGSIAKTLTDSEIIAYGRNENSLKQALKENVIQDYALEINEKFSNLDIIFICTPVDSMYSQVQRLSNFIKEDCVVTDIGSVKYNIVNAIEKNFPNINFIGGHPMVGSEKTGYNFSSHSLFKNAYYIITKTENTKSDSLDLLFELVQKLKAIPIIMDIEEHDFITSMISHIPHIIAASVVNLVKDNDSIELNMKKLVAGGFKDFTRIASSSPLIWEAICVQNKEEILKGLDEFKNIIDDFQNNLRNDNNLKIIDFFNSAKQYRDSIH